MRAVLVVSPHPDDAVLSAGQFLAGRPDCVVATVFAGVPETRTVATSYDTKCGFQTAQEAVVCRRHEDSEALSVLGAKHRHLDFIDSQYGFDLDVTQLITQLSKLIEKLNPEFVVGPLGLVHPDHEAVRDALLEATRDAAVPVWLWEDLPARVTDQQSVHNAVQNLHERGYGLELGFIGTGSVATKMDALFCYRSQLELPEFENRHCFLVPERFHRVVRAS